MHVVLPKSFSLNGCQPGTWC